MTRFLPWLLVACSGATSGPGALDPRMADKDGDGWTVGEGDCDDTDADVYPGAPDPPDDGKDQDCDGTDTAPLRAVALLEGDLVITEIHPDPIAVDPGLGEWFELRNTSGVPVDLMGLQILDDSGDLFTVDIPLVLDIDAYAVFGGWHEVELNGGAPVDLAWSGELGLGNAQDALVLRVPGGPTIDEVRWTPAFESGEGQSLALDPQLTDAQANDDPESWCVSPKTGEPYGLAGWGTPGSDNPPCDAPAGLPLGDVEVGELVITEVLQNPAAGDSSDGEWIEVHSLATELVNLAGLVVSDQDGNSATVDTYTPIPPGGYLVFASGSDAATNGGLSPDWTWDGAFGLGNGEDGVSLSFGTRVYDRVVYDNGVTFPDPDGASMQLDPAALDATANDDGSVWCVAQTPFGDGDLGTPGLPNPACP